MHQSIQLTPQYGTMPNTSSTTIAKCDIWDGGDPNSEPHHRFTAGQVYLYIPQAQPAIFIP